MGNKAMTTAVGGSVAQSEARVPMASEIGDTFPEVISEEHSPLSTYSPRKLENADREKHQLVRRIILLKIKAANLIMERKLADAKLQAQEAEATRLQEEIEAAFREKQAAAREKAGAFTESVAGMVASPPRRERRRLPPPFKSAFLHFP